LIKLEKFKDQKRGIGKLMEVLGNIPTPLNLFRKDLEV
jgi:hypothetical protein